jgi:hypothetical protein
MLMRALILLWLSIHAAAQSSQIFYWSIPREQIENAVRHVPEDSNARFLRLRSIFEQEQCKGGLMHEQPLLHKGQETGKNLFCVLNEDDSKGTILIVAHYPPEGEGASVVDNWSGAVMLPALYYSLQVAPHTHQYVFLALGGKDGAATYLHALSKEKKRSIKAVIALDSLGVDSLHDFSIPDFMEPLRPECLGLEMAFFRAALIYGINPIPSTNDPQQWIHQDDTVEFRHAKMPTLIIHSVSNDKYKLPRSKNDTIAAINMDRYYEAYKILCIYLGYLDMVADNLTAYDKILPSKEHR